MSDEPTKELRDELGPAGDTTDTQDTQDTQDNQTPAAGREEGQPTERIQPDAPSVSGPGPAAGPRGAPAEPHAERRGPSVPTVVWGLIFALIATAVIVVQVSDVDLNLDVTGPAVLLVAGAALVVWGIAGLGRARRR
jgi:hypothetical protein